MESRFRHHTDNELNDAPKQPGTLRPIPVHVIVELNNKQLITAQQGVFFEGERALPGGVESNAITIARRYGLIGTKAVGPLSLTDQDPDHIRGHAFILAPTLEARATDFAAIGLEVHNTDDLFQYHAELQVTAQEHGDPELLMRARRHTALLRAYGGEALRNL